MDRRVVDAVLTMPERDRFLRGMVAWVGFRQTCVAYDRDSRFAGETKYPIRKMLHFANDGLLSFSRVPLKLASLLGFSCSTLALLGMLFAVVARLFTHDWVQGWASIFLAVLFVGGVQLICLGIIGEYVGRIYGESKKRPLYFLAEVLDSGERQPEQRAASAARVH
jgi:dolichol-phosphate mannosyltransferase